MIKEMTFPHNWDYTTSSLIRRGCKIGRVIFLFDDDTFGGYELSINGNRVHFYLYKGDDGKYIRQQWVNQTEIPELLEHKMGLLIDRESKTIINVVDKHSAMPFSTSDAKCNARILSIITENPQLESTIQTLTNWKEQCANSAERLTSSRVRAYNQYKSIPKTDITTLQLRLNKKESALKLLEIIEPLIVSIDSLNNLKSNKPSQMVKLDIDKELESLDNLTKLDYELNNLINIINNKPTEIDYINIDNEISLLDNLNSIHCNLELLSNTIASKPKEIIDISDKIDSCINILNELNDLSNSVDKLAKLIKNKPKTIPDLIYLNDIIEIINQKPNFDDIQNSISMYEKHKFLNTKLKRLIHECEVKLKVCPLCGKPFDV